MIQPTQTPSNSQSTRQTESRSAPGPWLKKIGIFSTSRADAGIYQPLLARLAGEPSFETFFFAGGTHHAESFGRSVDSLSLPPRVKMIQVDHFVRGDRPVEVAATTAGAVAAFSNALDQHTCELVIVLGDRTEMLGACLAATIHGIPIAHLHGGDITLGAYDNACRDAITKLAHLHLPASQQHAARIMGMGEEFWRIHVVGAPALDALRSFKPISTAQLHAIMGLDLTAPTIILLFHPETISTIPVDEQIETVLTALDRWPHQVLAIGPNADVGHDAVRDRLNAFTLAGRRRLVTHLSREEFWSALAHAVVLVGNSSAGIIEAPAFRLPVVNVGRRQAGRIRAANVLDVGFDVESIRRAIQVATSFEFRWTLKDCASPYGDGGAAERIVRILHGLPEPAVLLCKR
jgi:UDP-hydrolysing UDP-N-acetyl-D-glucosamine 2-epimerase